MTLTDDAHTQTLNPEHILQIGMGFWASKTLLSAVELELFTHLAAPTMTRLRQPQRQVLDTLVDAGVARSRADALAWCVRLVAQHEDDWLTELRAAMSQVADVRTKGPRA